MTASFTGNFVDGYGGHYIHPSRLRHALSGSESINGNGQHTPRKPQMNWHDFHVQKMPLSPSSLDSERKRVVLTKSKFIQFVRDSLKERIDVKVITVAGQKAYEFYSSQF